MYPSLNAWPSYGLIYFPILIISADMADDEDPPIAQLCRAWIVRTAGKVELGPGGAFIGRLWFRVVVRLSPIFMNGLVLTIGLCGGSFYRTASNYLIT